VQGQVKWLSIDGVPHRGIDGPELSVKSQWDHDNMHSNSVIAMITSKSSGHNNLKSNDLSSQ
jgi:hypothetical protein